MAPPAFMSHSTNVMFDIASLADGVEVTMGNDTQYSMEKEFCLPWGHGKLSFEKRNLIVGGKKWGICALFRI